MSSHASEIALDTGAPSAAAPSRRYGRRATDRAWPYIRGAVISVVTIWIFVSAYLQLTPPTYVSRWILNLPGATSNVSVSLESIGQSNSTPSSPFSTSSLSPKVVYKEIADSEAVRARAATTFGETSKQFGKVRVRLIDETALMMFEIGANSPEAAKRKAEALMASFDIELERLRGDELNKRNVAVQRNLSDYQQQSRQVRESIIRAQGETGLVSTTQFAEIVSGLNQLKRRLIDLTAETEKIADEQKQLSSQLGTSATLAGQALLLAGDADIQKAVQEFAEASTLFAADNERFGERHPQRMASDNRREAALQRLKSRVQRTAPDSNPDDYNRLVAILNSSARSDLYTTLVRNDAALGGKRRELATLQAERTHLETEVTRLSPVVARLEELKKEQIVADAVLSSAMARIDSAKSDIFGSYPIVQVVSTPDLPIYAAQPRLLYAALGGVSGTFFACLAWTLAWLQSYHRSRRQKNALSSG